MMFGVQFKCSNLQEKGVVSSIFEAKYKKNGAFTTNEPISVLDTRSPSPSTSTSTFPSFNNLTQQGNMTVNDPAAVGAGGPNEVYLTDQQLGVEENEILKLIFQAGNQIEVQENMGFGAMDKNHGFTSGNVSSTYNASALGLFDSGFSFNDDENKGIFGLDTNCLLSYNNRGGTMPCLAPGGTNFEPQFETLGQKDEIFKPDSSAFNPTLVQNAANINAINMNPLFFGTQQELQNVGKVPFVDSGHDFSLMKHQESAQMLAGFSQTGLNHNQHQQIIYEHFHEAADSILAGNFSNAQGILARLNQLLSPISNPFQKSAFYVKEALESALTMPDRVPPSRFPAPFDGVLKMGAYKLFSEVSPLIQFTNFTANQALLEALNDAEKIHIIDFDIGFGAHWSSFLQELPSKNSRVNSLRITAFASPSTHHSVEISLMDENLRQFANSLGVRFELDVLNIDLLDPDSFPVTSFRSSENEAIAVNLPIWALTNYLSALPSYLRFVKKLSPKILVSFDRGCDRIDLPFSHHVLQTLQYYESLLDSIGAANMTPNSYNKVEKFLFQPKIESTILGRFVYPEITPPWRNLFASAGFVPLPISNFAETQAECLVKRTRVRGFHVERRNASLVLCWKRLEIMSVSAWIS